MRPSKTIFHRSVLLWGLAVLPIFGSGCSQGWKTMQVELPTGDTPESTFETLQAASAERDWPKFYGCLTNEARYDMIETLLRDGSHLNFRAKHDDEYIQIDPDRRRPLSGWEKEQALEVSAVFDEYQLPDRGRVWPGDIDNLDEFIPKISDALLLWEDNSLIDQESTMSDLRVDDDWAIAQVNDFHDRYHRDGWGKLHFKNVDGRWLIDASPWWTPWGPPTQKELIRQRAE